MDLILINQNIGKVFNGFITSLVTKPDRLTLIKWIPSSVVKHNNLYLI